MDERMLEFAEALTSATTQNSVERICKQVRGRDPSFDGHCEECAEPIPEARLNTGAQTCIDCQEILERIQAQYKR